MEPVTRPDKIVTDPLVLRQLERQGIDYRFVEFTDYGKRGLGISPFMKGYKDLKSGLRVAVASGLPMCNALGQRIEPNWKWQTDRYTAQYNLFSAVVGKAEITLVCLSDQPNGAKASDQVTYRPQLFVGGSEVHPTNEMPKLLEVDPINKDFLYNTLEWDYGVCKRRVRLIQGRFRERWVFATNPNAEVKIKHNQTGSYRLRLGEYAINKDEEVVPKKAFDRAEYPFEIGASATYYPDAHEETTSVDGYARHTESGLTWAQLVAGAGSVGGASEAELQPMHIEWYTNEWWNLWRGFFLFDSSGLGASAVISAGVFSIYGTEKYDACSITPDINVYSSAPASNTDIVAGDFDSVGSTAYCDTAITYANFDDAGYNDFTFNATGLAAISKTSITKLGTRNANYDVTGNTPGYSNGNAYSRVKCYFADQGSNKPKLVITYTIPFAPRVAGIV